MEDRDHSQLLDKDEDPTMSKEMTLRDNSTMCEQKISLNEIDTNKLTMKWEDSSPEGESGTISDEAVSTIEG